MSEGDLTPARTGVKLTYDDFLLFPDDGLRHELIDGEHYVSPSPTTKHQRISGNLFGLIWSHLRTQRIGEVFSAPFDVIFSDFDVVEPDVLYLSQQRLAEVEIDPHLRGAPNLVIEVGSVSTRRRDETAKLKLYERFNVDEYWIVDPRHAAISVYRHEKDRYVRTARLTRAHGDVLTTPLLPGLTMALGEIFGE